SEEAGDHHADDDRFRSVVDRRDGVIDGVEDGTAPRPDGQPDRKEQNDEDDAATFVAGNLAVHARNPTVRRSWQWGGLPGRRAVRRLFRGGTHARSAPVTSSNLLPGSRSGWVLARPPDVRF